METYNAQIDRETVGGYHLAVGCLADCNVHACRGVVHRPARLRRGDEAGPKHGIDRMDSCAGWPGGARQPAAGSIEAYRRRARSPGKPAVAMTARGGPLFLCEGTSCLAAKHDALARVLNSNRSTAISGAGGIVRPFGLATERLKLDRDSCGSSSYFR